MQMQGKRCVYQTQVIHVGKHKEHKKKKEAEPIKDQGEHSDYIHTRRHG